MGFMIYHPSIVAGISGDDAGMVLSSLEKVILSTRIKSVCNLGVWCISVQQLDALFLNAHIESLVRAIVHALDNPAGSLSTTFEAMQEPICSRFLSSFHSLELPVSSQPTQGSIKANAIENMPQKFPIKTAKLKTDKAIDHIVIPA
nr:hypothetical protein [Tanacetum cinerariifolium]